MLKSLSLQRILLISFYVIGSFFLFQHEIARYILDPDTTAALTLARHFSENRWLDGVSAYWSPLAPILVSFFMRWGFQPLVSAELYCLILGACILWICSWWLNQTLQSNTLRFFSLILLMPIVWQMKYRFIDMTLCFWLLLFLTCFYNYLKTSNITYFFYTALTAAFSFFTKSYALPFTLVFILVIGVWNILLKDKSRFSKIKTLQFIRLVFFIFLLASTWILGPLYAKYHRITFGDSGRFAHNIQHPDLNTAYSLPIAQIGLIAPPTKFGLSSWDDPIIETSMSKPWGVLSSLKNFRHQLYLVARNIYSAILIYKDFSIFSFLIISVLIVYFFTNKNKISPVVPIFYLNLATLLFLSGYLLLFLRDRYIWMNLLILVITLSILIEKYLLHLKAQLKTILIFLLMISFIIYPYKTLINGANQYKSFYTVANILKENCSLSGAIASNKYYDLSTYLAFHSKNSYFGVPRFDSLSKDIESEISSRNIDYFLFWDPETENAKYAFLSKYKKLTLPKYPDFESKLEIYYLKSNPPGTCEAAFMNSMI